MAPQRAERRTLEREREPLKDAAVKKLPPPEKGNKVYYDADVPGFGCRVTTAGDRSFVLNYRTRGRRERRITIGRFPDWSTTGARAEAKRLRRLIDEGGDPLNDIQAEREAPTVDDLCDRFEEEHLPRKRPGTETNYKILIKKYIRPELKNLKVAEVAFADIDRLHHKVTKAGSPYAANRMVAVLSKMFSLAIRWKMRADNPCKGIEKNTENQRRRYLSGDELAALTKALAAHPDKQAANIIRMLLLTGARRGEVLSMRWADLEISKKDRNGNVIGTWSKPASSTKQNEDHEVPLSAPARLLLTEIAAKQKKPLGMFVFPSDGESGHVVEIKRAWRTICKSAGISGLRIHDLRHSFASQLVSTGSSLPLIGALLGHSNPATTARYAHLFDDPQRAAVEKVAAIIGAAGKTATEPTPLHPAASGTKRRGR